eukprot:jgi/Phyca11/560795/estExt2_Genewise1.C_PHYCAscaffold_50690
MDSTTSTSIFTMLFKQKESQDCPQEEDESVSTKEEVPISTKVEEPQCQRIPLRVPVKQPTLLADLHLLQQTTQQLQNATLISASNNSDDNGDASTDTENLATLYCRRAAALLAFVDYDATTSVPLDILSSESSANDSHDEANQPAPMLEAVRQALQDSQAAAALTLNNATLAEAHLLSAYSSRSLGELSNARAFIALATEALPGSTALTSLAEQLDVEARTGGAELLPKLRTTSETLAALSRSSDVPTIVEEEDNNGQPDQKTTKGEPLNAAAAVQSSFWSQVATPFQVLEEAARSSWLEKIERIMHLNVHHRCAHPSEVCQLDAALQAALAALTLLLQCSAVCSTFELDMTTDDAARTLEKLNQAASSSSQTLVQNRTARKWIAQTWAPAVRRAVVSASRSPLIDLSSDVLVMLSRLLQASGSWRRCTATSHGLAYAEMGFDLAKYSRGNFTDPSAWTRLEMQCAEAYATALLQRSSGHKDALKTSRETLQAALHVGDHEYELRLRLLVARTLRFMNEREIAHAELVLLLERSRALNDVHVEAMAEYELGEHFVQKENLEAAQEHFHIAQALCNRTGNCGNSWRPQSIQQAIAFYAQLRPITRRGAMRCSVSTLVQPVDEDNSASTEAQHNDEDNGEQEEEAIQRPKARRQAFYLKQEQPEPQSVMSKLFNTTDSLGRPKPKRTTSWRESVFEETWPETTAVAQ